MKRSKIPALGIEDDKDDALGKILSDAIARSAAIFMEQPSESVEPIVTTKNESNDFFGQNPNRKSKPMILNTEQQRSHQELTELFSQAQNHLATVEFLKHHEKSQPRPQSAPSASKAYLRPTSSKVSKTKGKLPISSKTHPKQLNDQTTTKNELEQCYKALKNLHNKLREHFERPVNYSQEIEIPFFSQILKDKAQELCELEETLRYERETLIENLKEMKHIRAKVEAKDIRLQKELDLLNEFKQRVIDEQRTFQESKKTLQDQQRLLEERAREIEATELMLARQKLELMEREKEIRLKTISLQEIKQALNTEFGRWETELHERERKIQDKAQIASASAKKQALSIKTRQSLLDKQLEDMLETRKGLRQQETEQRKAWTEIQEKIHVLDIYTPSVDRISSSSKNMLQI